MLLVLYISGMALSFRYLIKVIIPENAYLMIHKAWGVSWGNADELRKQAEMLDKVDDGILGIYMKKAKISEDEMKQLERTSKLLNIVFAISRL